MEQSKQIVNSAPTAKKLPIKTRIAVWWLTTSGMILTTLSVALCLNGTLDIGTEDILYLILLLFGIIYCTLPAILLCLKRRRDWIAAVIMLSLGLLTPYFVLAAIGLIPLILVILDYSNYWEMTSCISAKAKSKASGEVSG